jgi:hypothetical protein
MRKFVYMPWYCFLIDSFTFFVPQTRKLNGKKGKEESGVMLEAQLSKKLLPFLYEFLKAFTV